MGRNLKYQFKTCIEKKFKEKMNKHSIKKINKWIRKRIHEIMKNGSNGQKVIEIGKNFGLRVSEITKLQKRYIDLEKNTCKRRKIRER